MGCVSRVRRRVSGSDLQDSLGRRQRRRIRTARRVTVRAIAGLTVLNVFLAVLGSAVLHGVRPATTRRELVRLGGVSYLLGVGSLMIGLTLLIVLGIPVNLFSTVLLAVALFAAASALGR